MNKYTPGTQSKGGNKFTSAIITIIVCVILSAIAIGYAMMNPKSDFDFIPNLKKPGKTHYSDMEYERPKISEIIENTDTLIEMVNDEKPFMDQSKLFTIINSDLTNLSTMASLAQIRFYSDMTDDFYRTENDYISLRTVEVENKIAQLFDIIAKSSFKTNYERSFLGTGYFDDWKKSTLPEEAVLLLQKEKKLIAKYNKAMSNPFVNIDGKDICLNSKEFKDMSKEDSEKVQKAYCKKYHELAGNIYVELVKVRLQFAKEVGQNYMDYSFDALGRDYEYKKANEYIENLRVNVITPLMKKIDLSNTKLNVYTDTVTSLYYLSTAAHNMGGTISESFDYMMKYGLYELSYSDNKPSLSFQAYLNKFNSPFIFVSSNRTMRDFLTFSHEFGHFVDSYANLNEGITVDNAEIASQAMAYLAPMYLGNSGTLSKDAYLRQNMALTINMYISVYLTNFLETGAYSMQADEVTLEKLESIAYNGAKKLGFDDAAANIISKSWFEIQHIYLSPMYNVSYAISNDIALQILDKELNQNKGVSAFENIIDRDENAGFIKDLTNSGFKSPFDKDRTTDIYKMINGIFFPKADDDAESETETETGAESMQESESESETEKIAA